MNVRPMTLDDVPALTEFLVREEERLTGRPCQFGEADVRDWTSRTDFEHDSRLAEDGSRIAAAAWLRVNEGRAVGVVAVSEHVQASSIGAEFVEWCEGRARELAATRMHQHALGVDTYARDLLASLGYRDVRHFYDMAIELTDRPELASVEIETLRAEEAEAFYESLDAAFQDHWEHHSRPFAEWYERHSSSPNFDLNLWFLIRSEGEIAAVALNEANRNGGGYVGILGVRREFRGRGYAKALLYRAFAEFWDRGLTRVTLGVDAENSTGATHLYEAVGMHVEAENIVYEKALA